MLTQNLEEPTTDARDEKEKKRREKRLTPSGANHSRKTTMTEQTLLADLSRQFPQLPNLDLTLLTRTLFPLSPVELYTLRLAHGDNAMMKAAIDSTIRQRQEEKEIAALERQHEIYDEYRHCCGGW
jgi:hypothetical protein